MTKLKTIVVMPAYNAALTLEKTIKELPPESVDEIILGDDAVKIIQQKLPNP
jgi:glycosyltransferase involved in cell wall biosynthesis